MTQFCVLQNSGQIYCVANWYVHKAHFHTWVRESRWSQITVPESRRTQLGDLINQWQNATRSIFKCFLPPYIHLFRVCVCVCECVVILDCEIVQEPQPREAKGGDYQGGREGGWDPSHVIGRKPWVWSLQMVMVAMATTSSASVSFRSGADSGAFYHTHAWRDDVSSLHAQTVPSQHNRDT